MHPIFHRIGHHARRHYHERYVKPHGAKAHIILTIDGILVSFILALLGLGAYFAFVYDPLRDTFAMRFEETTLVAGSASEVALTVENTGKTGLSDVSVDLFFPPQFRVFSQAQETDRDEVAFGSLPAGASVTYRFQGILLGPAGEAPVFARMRGTDGFGETDERFISGRLVWTENRLALDWDVPTTVVRGQDIPMTLRVRNLSSLTLDSARLDLILPEDFTVRLSTPPIGPDGILLGELRPGDEFSIDFLGSFGDGAEVTAEPLRAGLFWSEDSGETLVATTETEIAVITADIRLEAAFVNPQTHVLPGSDIPFTISYENASPHTLTDLKLRLPLDIRIADLKGSVADEGGAAGSSLGWESVTLGSLGEIPPGGTGTVTGTIRLLTDISRYSTDPLLELKPEAVFDIGEFGISEARLFGEGQAVKVAGRVDVAGVARYYTNEGDQIGRGPLPPRVGAATRYWVVLKAQNGATEAKNARLTVRLPEHVRWTGKAAVTAGFEIQEAEGGQLLTWNIGSIPAHAGIVSPAPNASIELALTPTSELIGTAPALISGATLTATDAWTGLEMSSQQASLTTELSTDPFIDGRTIVRP